MAKKKPKPRRRTPKKPEPQKPVSAEQPQTVEEPKLTAKEQLFVSKLIGEANGNATKAAELAGYQATTRESLMVIAARTKARPHVKAAISEALGQVKLDGIAVVENRIVALQDRWDRMKALIAARAEDPQMQKVTGGTTGLLVHNIKSIGQGRDAERVDVYEIDAALLREMRELERQAAQEMGQWLDRSEVSGKIDLDRRAATHRTMAEIFGDPQAHAALGVLADRLTANDATATHAKP
jgi:phage terminase small subunit